MFEAVARARGEHWGPLEELAAMQTELLHALLTAFINANSKRPPRIKPLHIPRPGEAPAIPGRHVIRPRDLARHMGGR